MGRPRARAATSTCSAQTESVFALSNGHIGLRGNLDEGEPHGLPGTYLNGFYETRPLPYAEAGYGYPEDGQTIVNVTNGKVIRLLVDDEPFDVRYGELVRHERVLDLRDGVLRREVEWRSPAGAAVRVRSTRLVSFVHRAVAAICYEVEPLEAPGADRRPVRAGGQRAGARRRPTTRGPRRRCARRSWPSATATTSCGAGLVHRTRASGLRMAAGMDHVVDGPDGTRDRGRERADDLARVTVTTELAPGETLRVVKFAGLRLVERSAPRPSLRDQVDAALASARAHRLGRPARRPARVPRRRSGSAPTSSSRATPRSSRRCASRSSTSCRPAPAPSSGRSRPRA